MKKCITVKPSDKADTMTLSDGSKIEIRMNSATQVQDQYSVCVKSHRKYEDFTLGVFTLLIVFTTFYFFIKSNFNYKG